MTIFKCKMCGGALEINSETVAVCEYCGTKQTVPKVQNELVSNLFNRANSLRLKCEFDKAEQVYEKILDLDNTDPEAHWGIVLCKYGIEYVEDPKTYTRVPTCHRTLYEAVLTDTDYVAAIEHADMEQKALYVAEARAIDALQKDILSIVNNEAPFDVFICYKEADADSKRTIDSSITNDIYFELTDSGFKVFYAPITLEDKLGHEYEPYIFAALNSAKVMLVVATKPEYFEAVWVRNEWSRFLKFTKSDRSKLLIPCYRDMDAYEMPDEFAHLQAQDMSKIGFINDIVRGIKKVVHPDTADMQNNIQQTNATVAMSTNTIAPLLKRISLFLEDDEFEKADDFCEQVLNTDPENADAYIYKLLIEFKCHTVEELTKLSTSIKNSKNYSKVIRFGTDVQASVLENAEKVIQENIARIAMIRKAEQKRLEEEEARLRQLEEERLRQLEEERLKRLNSDEDIDFDTEQYYDVECPHCGEELSFMSWQIDENSETICPMCGSSFKVHFVD